MNKTKIIVSACACVVFAAGVVAGVAGSESLKAKPTRDRHAYDWREQHSQRSSLKRELDLTPEQHKQMQDIWSNTMKKTGAQYHQHMEALREQREQSIRGILTEEQMARYEELRQEHFRKISELSAARKRAFAEAVEQTKKILTEEQRAKYEELLKRHSGPPSMPGGNQPPERQGTRAYEPGEIRTRRGE